MCLPRWVCNFGQCCSIRHWATASSSFFRYLNLGFPRFSSNWIYNRPGKETSFRNGGRGPFLFRTCSLHSWLAARTRWEILPLDSTAPLSLRVEWKHSTEVLCLSLDTDDHHSWTSLRAQKVRWPRIAVVATRSEHATLAVNSPLSAQAQVCDRVRRDAAHSTQAHSAPRATTCFIS